MDLVFFHERSIYVFYNKLKSKQYNSGSIDDQQNLCFSHKEVDGVNDIFDDITTLNQTELVNGGSYYITIQDIEPLLRKTN